MKQPIRSFSIGLFTAGVIMLVGVYFFETPNDTEQLPVVDEMIPAVEEEGYRVLTESDYISLSVNEDNNEDDQEDTEETEEDESEEENEHSYTLTIEPGMPSSDIGPLLVENQIVDDADDFNQYLDEEDYSLYIQLGEYDLSSDMSFYEIAEVIAN
ncbi:hypothetical protein J2Z83_003927 [Virgibacillus natechei]|uniref:Endolytic transglycosylase MltG n=1 Tax=Virgibacillus natechei TaxID=1216297 RepID=A0ABS4ILE0_9BACI|nr:hypothetical protein [Virgibacillus natechei]MBP1971772.1 hypothetical protein [Virgibacillus natechei]UZD11477.1 endolytic transglycosylase MltG [Virgibacillus natechei]